MDSKIQTILIADDIRFNRSLIKMCLHGGLYDFIEAKNGYEVLQQVENYSVDLVILDLMMPELDGFNCLAQLKADESYAGIPVIINSSLEDLDSVKKALALGCYDYFIKSLPQNELQIILPLKVKNAIAAKILFDQVAAQNQMLAEEMQEAGTYQRFLLPTDAFAKGLSIRQSYHPHLDVGGDFFDFIPLSRDRTAILIADVSGHGILSAMITALLKPLFERYIIETDSPAQTLGQLNEDFLRLTDNSKFVTAFAAIYDPAKQSLCYANAGHPPPLYLRRMSGSIDLLKATGTLLGLFSKDEWVIDEICLPIMPYDRLLMVTDGVLEAMSPSGTMFGLEGLCQVVEDSAESNLDTMTEEIWSRLEDFTEAEFKDDVTFITADFREIEAACVLHLPSDPDLVLDTVDEILTGLGAELTDADHYAIRISLVEILMNAIEHGNLEIGYEQKQVALVNGTYDDLICHRQQLSPYAARLVTISYTVTSAYISCTIRDEGHGFDWEMASGQQYGDEPPRPHGQGLLIARTYMDHCLFHHPGNTVTLVKYFSSALNCPSGVGPAGESDLFTATARVGKDVFMNAASSVGDDVSLLTLEGPINFTARKTLGELVNTDLAQGRRNFILDLSDVSFIDSSGLGVLVTCFTTIRKQGGQLKLVEVPDNVRTLLEMTKLTDFFEICASTADALSSVRM